MIDLIIKNGKYGIKENDDIIVPLVYSDVNGAIEEYEYFERLNTNDKQFLNRKLTNDKIDEIGKEMIDEIKSVITESIGKNSMLESKFNAKLSQILKSQLNNINYLPQVENDWKERLSKEFKQRGLTNISQTEWVSQQMNTTFKDEIQNDLNSEIEFLLTGIGTDISAASVKFMDAINKNGKTLKVRMK